MVGLNPGVLGWTEFWLRIGVLVALFAVIALAAAVTVRVILDLKTGVGWILRKAGRRGIQ